MNQFLQILNEAASAITHAALVVEAVKDHPDLYNKYNKQLKEMIIEYNQQVIQLRGLMDTFFKKEREKGSAINFQLRKAYNSLKTLDF